MLRCFACYAHAIVQSGISRSHSGSFDGVGAATVSIAGSSLIASFLQSPSSSSLLFAANFCNIAMREESVLSSLLHLDTIFFTLRPSLQDIERTFELPTVICTTKSHRHSRRRYEKT
ncbi:hypothetical protein KC325_g99 [Hortaea werneckii]|nr:hypothetical protein KC325_g99 [Hortaea werneckii]